MTVHILSHSSEHTTARYFERAARTIDSNEVVYWDAAFDADRLGADDFLLVVDPPPDLPLGLDTAACVTAAYFIDVHQDLSSRIELSKLFDVVFVAQKDCISPFRRIGHRRVHWLPLACDPNLNSEPSRTKMYDVGFIGKLGAQGSPRYQILTGVLPRFQTNDFKRYYAPREMASIYGQSKIVFNASINGDLNMRFFEAMASGAMLVTDRIENGLQNLFQEGKHYVGYSTVDEALGKIDYYLAHEDERARIASAGHALTRARDTYCNRWDSLVGLCSKAGRDGLARTLTRGELADVYSSCFALLRRPGRIPAVFARYGLGRSLLRNYMVSNARWLNARVPLTPNAIKARLRSG